jgi:hypothetical protein
MSTSEADIDCSTITQSIRSGELLSFDSGIKQDFTLAFLARARFSARISTNDIGRAKFKASAVLLTISSVASSPIDINIDMQVVQDFRLEVHVCFAIFLRSSII